MPVSAPFSPLPIESSAARASAIARPASTLMNALSFPSSDSMRARCACVSSTLENRFARSDADNSAMDASIIGERPRGRRNGALRAVGSARTK
jgi:hypothetical protein